MQIQNTNYSWKPNILQGPSLLLHANSNRGKGGGGGMGSAVSPDKSSSIFARYSISWSFYGVSVRHIDKEDLANGIRRGIGCMHGPCAVVLHAFMSSTSQPNILTFEKGANGVVLIL